MKTCSKCKNSHSKDKFTKQKASKDGLGAWCQDCRSLYNKKYNKENKERIQSVKKIWRENNKEIRSQQNKEWMEQNKEYRKQYKLRYRRENRNSINEYKRKKYKEDMTCPYFVLKERLRSRYRKAIQNKCSKKKCMEILGCDFDYFTKYIELKFQEGMSWDNIGKWHIDHIKPISKFDLNNPNEVTECFHYTNLQPLWEKDNLSKGNKYDSKK